MIPTGIIIMTSGVLLVKAESAATSASSIATAVRGGSFALSVTIDSHAAWVIVDIQIQAHHAADEDRPQAHARPPIGLAHRRRYPRFEQLKQRTTQRQIGVDVLQAAQYLRDVVTGSRIKGDRRELSTSPT